MSSPVNVCVELRDDESQEKLLRRFLKKCKKTEIVKEHLEKTAFYRSPSRKRRDKIQKNKHFRMIEQSRMQRKQAKRS